MYKEILLMASLALNIATFSYIHLNRRKFYTVNITLLKSRLKRDYDSMKDSNDLKNQRELDDIEKLHTYLNDQFGSYIKNKVFWEEEYDIIKANHPIITKYVKYD